MLIDYYAFDSQEEQLEDRISRRQQAQVFEIEDFIITEDNLLYREGLRIPSQIRCLRTARDLQEETEFNFDDINFDFAHKVKAYNERRLQLITHYAYCKENNLVMKLTIVEEKK